MKPDGDQQASHTVFLLKTALKKVKQKAPLALTKSKCLLL